MLRALQGTASASINSTCFSLAANKYANEVTFVVGVLEATSGIGLVIGLLGGSIINESIGYKAVFIFFGSLLPILAVIVRVLFHCIESQEKKLNARILTNDELLLAVETADNFSTKVVSDVNEGDNDDDFYKLNKVFDNPRLVQPGYLQLLSNPRILFACFTASLSTIIYAEFEPILVLRLKDFDASPIQTAVCMSIYGFFYIAGTLLVPLIPKRIQNRCILITASFLIGVFLFLVGPSQILGF